MTAEVEAVAVGMADSPDIGLALVERLGESLNGYHLLPATRAYFLRRVGRAEEAAYREAMKLAPTAAERVYLAGRLASVLSA
jgi:predicted RNA polymerase sigma factor